MFGAWINVNTKRCSRYFSEGKWCLSMLTLSVMLQCLGSNITNPVAATHCSSPQPYRLPSSIPCLRKTLSISPSKSEHHSLQHKTTISTQSLHSLLICNSKASTYLLHFLPCSCNLTSISIPAATDMQHFTNPSKQ